MVNLNNLNVRKLLIFKSFNFIHFFLIITLFTFSGHIGLILSNKKVNKFQYLNVLVASFVNLTFFVFNKYFTNATYHGLFEVFFKSTFNDNYIFKKLVFSVRSFGLARFYNFMFNGSLYKQTSQLSD